MPAGLDDGDFPSLQEAADETSLVGQRRYLRALKTVLAASVIAALGGGLATSVDGWRWAGYVSAIAFLGTIAVSVYLAVLRPERSWYDGRAASESAKSLAWEYAVGGGPFCIKTCEDADELLVSRLREIVTRLRDFAVDADEGAGEQITAAMRETRSQPLEGRRAAYVRDRLEDQQSWYTQKARWNSDRYHRWLVVSLVAQALGVISGFLLAAGRVHFDGLGVLAVVAAAIAAWVQAKDHSGLATAYGIAAQELGFAKVRLQYEDDEEAFASLVDDAEQAISREHTLWLARRGSVSNAG